jgi:hypothetical protein
MNKSRIWFSLQIYKGGWQEVETFKKHRQVMQRLKALRGVEVSEKYRVIPKRILTAI